SQSMTWSHVMPQPERGRIVWVDLPDPQGRNPKRRPVAILTATEEIEPGEPLVGVAISTTIDPSSSGAHVELPWHREVRAKTGLKQRSVAVCNWLVAFDVSAIQE